MREYETVIVLDAALDETRVDEEIETVGKVIADGGGEVLDVQRWGRRRLAYEVHKKREGVYSLIRYKSEASVLDELERRFRLNDAMLRHLTVISRGPSTFPGLDERDRDESRRGGPDGGRRRESGPGRPDRASAGAKPAEATKSADDAGSAKGAAAAGSGTETVADPAATDAAASDAAATDAAATDAAASNAAATDAAATDAAASDAAASDAAGDAAPEGAEEPPATDADAASGEQDADAANKKTQD